MELYKIRDLGGIISGAFKFIREESENFFSIYFRIIWVYIAIALLSQFFLLQEAPLGIEGDGGLETFGIFRYVIFTMITTVMGYAVNIFTAAIVLNYLKCYLEGDRDIRHEKVRKQVYKRFWSYVGLSILTYLIIVISAFILLLPMVYFAIVFALAFPIMILEDISVTDAMGRCFTLIKDEWWNTFGTVLVIGLVFVVLALSFGVPLYIYTFIFEGASLYQIIEKDPIHIGLSLLMDVGGYFLNSVFIFMLAFVYFDLHEKKYKTGMNGLIEKIGAKF